MSIIAKKEYSTINQFQNDIHECDGPKCEIASLCYQQPYKSYWYSLCQEILSSIEGSENHISYKLNNAFQFLLSTRISQKFPEMRVAPAYEGKVRICWPHNVAINILLSCELLYGTQRIMGFDVHYGNIHPQFSMKFNYTDRFPIDVGNISCIENWSSWFPSFITDYDLPLSYSDDTSLGFPIWRFNSNDQIIHSIDYIRDISKIIRMQELIDGEWTNIKPNMSYLMSSTFRLDKPEIWGEYSCHIDKELNEHRCNGEYKIYYTDIINIDDINDIPAGKSVQLPLVCSAPCLGIYWTAELAEATQYNNLGNYSNNIDSVYKGSDPIITNTLMYGTDKVFKDVPSYVFNSSVPRKHARSIPFEPGYHLWALNSYVDDILPSKGVIFTPDLGVTLKVDFRQPSSNAIKIVSESSFSQRIFDENPKLSMRDSDLTSEKETHSQMSSRFKKLQSVKENESENYKLHVRLKCQRCMTFTPEGNGPNPTYTVKLSD